MKKILSLAICVLMLLFTVLPISATSDMTANTSLDLSVSSALAGETVTVTVSVSDSIKAKSFMVEPIYDSKVLELTSASWSIKGFALADIDADGCGVMAFSEETDLNQELIRYTFKVKADAAPGTTTITCNVMIKNPDCAVNSDQKTLAISAPHFHLYNRKNTSPKFLKSAATCSSPAVYYHSCSCGEIGTTTFEYGEKADHAFDQKNTDSKYLKSVATCTSPAVYYYSCVCGEMGTTTFEYGEKLAHTFDQKNTDSKYLKSAATCTSKAVYYYSCTCGEKGTATFEYGNLLSHNFGAWTKLDANYHTHKCSACGFTEKQAHNWDGGKTSNGETVYTCKTCGATKTEKTPGTTVVKVTVPAKDTKTYVYTGSTIEYVVASSEYYTVSGNKQVNAGQYEVVISLKDKAKYCWADGTTGDLKYSFVIEKAEYDMSKVVFADKVVIENGNPQAIYALNLPEGVSVSYTGNDVKDPGTYTVTASFKGDQNYQDIADMTAKLIILAKPKTPIVLTNDWGSVEGYLPEGLVLVIEELDKVNSEVYKKACNAVIEHAGVKKESILGALDISLRFENVSVQPNGQIKITVKIPEFIVGKSFDLYHVHTDEAGKVTAEKVEFQKDKKNTISVTVDKLSQLVFVENENSTSAPGSSSVILFVIIGVVVAAGVAAGVVILLLKKKQKKNTVG